MRILIGDDHAVIRDCLRQVCQQFEADVGVLEAASYREVLDHLAAGPDVDLVILDLCMPGMGALDGLDAVRRAYGGRIAVISAIEDRGTVKAVLARGVAGYIPKRLGLEAIGSALRLTLAGETFVPSLMLADPEIGASRHVSSSLTGREREVLALLRNGLSNKGIARQLNLSEVTVKTHLSNAFRKLGVHNRVQAARVEQ